MTPLEHWLDALAYTEFPDSLFKVGDTAGTRPYAAEIEEMLAPDHGIAASASLVAICRRCSSMRQSCLSRTSSGWRKFARGSGIRTSYPSCWFSNWKASAPAVNDRNAEPDLLARSDAQERGYWSA
jgi:hypothetical protein